MLTETQKEQCRVFLGYPDMYRYRHSRLESVLTNLSPEAETMIADVLGKIATVDTALLDAGTNLAGLKRVDEIWFENGKVRVTIVVALGRRYVNRLSIILGVPVYSDYFGIRGYVGDSFLPGNGEGTGGGFYNLG